MQGRGSKGLLIRAAWGATCALLLSALFLVSGASAQGGPAFSDDFIRPSEGDVVQPGTKVRLPCVYEKGGTAQGGNHHPGDTHPHHGDTRYERFRQGSVTGEDGFAIGPDLPCSTGGETVAIDDPGFYTYFEWAYSEVETYDCDEEPNPCHCVDDPEHPQYCTAFDYEFNGGWKREEGLSYSREYLVTFEVTALAPRFNKDEKDQIGDLSNDLGGLASACAMALVNPALTPTIGPALAVCAAAPGSASWLLNRLAKDPPDPGYRSLAKPQRPQVEPVVAGNGVSAAAADALNKLNRHMATSAATHTALLTTIERATAARADRKRGEETRQMEWAGKLASKVAKLLEGERPLRTAAANALRDSGVSFALDASQIEAAQAQIANGGLPPEVAETFGRLGAPPELTQSVEFSIVAAAPADVAFSYPDVLVSGDSLRGLKEGAKAMRSFAARMKKSPLKVFD